MINLAGEDPKFTTKICEIELFMCGIPTIPIPNNHPEVKSSVGGELKGIRFRRAWYYWMASGRVPLESAKRLYTGLAAKDIRVAGHCGNVAPESPWIDWYLPSGRPVLPMSAKADCENYLSGNSEVMKQIAKDVLANNEFSDDPASIGASGFISMYHIDSIIGLRVFADELIKSVQA